MNALDDAFDQVVDPSPIAVVTQAEEAQELLNAYWDDNELYCKTFFPKTCRQGDAGFHKVIDRALWSRRRKVAIKVFRDGAKTSRIRMFLSKRIAYAISRTILYISKSEDAAEATVQWLANRIETRDHWAQFYGLQKGSIWSATDIEIVNTVENVKIRIIAVGIHGQIRGLNFDDFRPDLIICDDIEDEKTTNTKEQIKKHSDLLHGTVMRSLASPVDNPDSMIVIIQTPLDIEDAVETAFANAGDDQWSQWLCVEASCFIYNESGYPIASSWPEKFPFEFLMGEKESYIKINKLSVWLREMEVTVTSKETCSFLAEWLQKHDALPNGMWDELILTIDPASSDSDKADFQAVVLQGKMGGQAWLCGYNLSKGQDIDDSVTKFFQTWDLMLVLGKGKANLRFGVETIGYQRQLERHIKKEMLRRERYAYIEPLGDKRKKEDVINQAFTAVASMGQYHCLNSHSDFISDFEKYPKVKKDDLLDGAARGLDMMDLTGRASQGALGGVERVMATPGIIARSANRVIRGNALRQLGARLGR